MNLLINIIAFKVGWLASVVGAANQLPMLGPAVVLIAILLHLRNSNEPMVELQLILVSGIIGAVCDSLMVSAGWLSYPSGTVVAGFAPYWIVGMWMLFATTFNLAFRWLRDRVSLAFVLGAIFGPLSYYFGSRLGAVVLEDPKAAMIALSITWAIVFPALLTLAQRFDGTLLAVIEERT